MLPETPETLSEDEIYSVVAQNCLENDLHYDNVSPDWIHVTKRIFDVSWKDEPYSGASLLINPDSGTYLSRVWDKTVLKGTLTDKKHLEKVLKKSLTELQPCLGFSDGRVGPGIVEAEWPFKSFRSDRCLFYTKAKEGTQMCCGPCTKARLKSRNLNSCGCCDKKFVQLLKVVEQLKEHLFQWHQNIGSSEDVAVDSHDPAAAASSENEEEEEEADVPFPNEEDMEELELDNEDFLNEDLNGISSDYAAASDGGDVKSDPDDPPEVSSAEKAAAAVFQLDKNYSGNEDDKGGDSDNDEPLTKRRKRSRVRVKKETEKKPKRTTRKTRVRKPKEEPDSEPCLLYTSPSPRDRQKSRMPSSA